MGNRIAKIFQSYCSACCKSDMNAELEEIEMSAQAQCRAIEENEVAELNRMHAYDLYSRQRRRNAFLSNQQNTNNE